jgi:hypothetical protein
MLKALWQLENPSTHKNVAAAMAPDKSLVLLQAPQPAIVKTNISMGWAKGDV